MKDFFECLNGYMLAEPRLKKLFGTRIYPLMLPQKPQFPSMVYQPITTIYHRNLQAESMFIRQVVQFTIHDTTFGKTRTARKIVKSVFQDFVGDMNGVWVQAVHTISDLTSGNGTTTQYSVDEYCAVLEFEFNYMEE